VIYFLSPFKVENKSEKIIVTMESKFDDLSDRAQLVFMAKLAEQAERFEEMVEYMRRVANLGDGNSAEELSVEERNLLSVAYKNVIGSRRASWRVITAIDGTDSHKKLIENYRKKIESELCNICNNILDVITEKLIPSCNSDEGINQRNPK